MTPKEDSNFENVSIESMLSSPVVQKVPSTTFIDIIFYMTIIILLALIFGKVSQPSKSNVIIPDSFTITIKQEPIQVNIPELKVTHSYEGIRIENTTKEVTFELPKTKNEIEVPVEINKPEEKKEEIKPKKWYNPFSWRKSNK